LGATHIGTTAAVYAPSIKLWLRRKLSKASRKRLRAGVSGVGPSGEREAAKNAS